MEIGDLILTDETGERWHTWKMGTIIEKLKPMGTDKRLFRVLVGNKTIRCWESNLLCEEAYRGRSGSPAFGGPSILSWGGAKWKMGLTAGGGK